MPWLTLLALLPVLQGVPVPMTAAGSQNIVCLMMWAVCAASCMNCISIDIWPLLEVASTAVLLAGGAGVGCERP